MWGMGRNPAAEEATSSETLLSAMVAGVALVPAMTTAATTATMTATQPAMPLAVTVTMTGVVAKTIAAHVKPEPHRKGKQVAMWPPVPCNGIKLKPKCVCLNIWHVLC